MNPSLEEFLKINELDDLLKASENLPEPSPQDAEAIAAILSDWTNRQAVANLLFCPELIPEDIRIDSVLRGLREESFAY